MSFNDPDHLSNLLFYKMVDIWNSYLVAFGISLWLLTSLVVIAIDFSDCKQVRKTWFKVNTKKLRNHLLQPYRTAILLQLHYKVLLELIVTKAVVHSVHRPEVHNFIKKETLAQVLTYEFCQIFNNTFFTKHLWRLLL